MYVPASFETPDPATDLTLLRRSGFGHLVTAADGMVSSPLPFLIDDEMTTVRAHLARANPHWRTIDGEVALLIVSVTDAYVSPSWYPSKAKTAEVVPTWNYEAVQVRGTVAVHQEPDWLEQMVRDLTDHHEISAASDNPPWSLDDAPRPFVERMLEAIVGIELGISDIEGKQKLSQNRPEPDRHAVAETLLASSIERNQAVGQAMSDMPEIRSV